MERGRGIWLGLGLVYITHATRNQNQHTSLSTLRRFSTRPQTTNILLLALSGSLSGSWDL
jgi:putative copper export protein